MSYVWILLSTTAVLVAISEIKSEKRKRDRAKRKLEQFEKRYPPRK
jgi:TolA-binding protein